MIEKLNSLFGGVNDLFVDWLVARLKGAMPPKESRARFAPALSHGRHFGPAPATARDASVIILLYHADGEWRLPLTLRPETMLAHAGQISLPGGEVEPGETSSEAALRELEEELGVTATSVSILGSLSPLYVFVSNFWVTPWVAVAPAPVTFRPNADEVAEVLEASLAHLADPRNHGVGQYRRGDLEFSAPHFSWKDHRIWGATAMILGELTAILHEYADAAHRPMR
ncbi:MAG TPA: CoA pyrophosphatase [Pirellulales bacterium]